MSWSAVLSIACVDTDALDSRLDSLEDRIRSLETAVSTVNDNALAASALLRENTLIVGITETGNGYVLEMEDGLTVEVIYGMDAEGIVPLIGIDENGRWTMSFDGGVTFSVIPGCADAFQQPAATPEVKIDEKGFWCISKDGGKTWSQITGADGKPVSATDGKSLAGVKTWFTEVSYNEAEGVMSFTLADGRSFSVPVVSTFYMNLKGYEEDAAIEPGETLAYEVELSDVADVAVQAPEGWTVIINENGLSVTAPEDAVEGKYSISVYMVSGKGYVKSVSLTFTVITKTDLLAKVQDFSYAGYMHGETAPSDVYSLGYEVYDVTEYGAVPDDGKSDRDAFLKTLDAALGVSRTIDSNGWISYGHKEKADVIIYFPEGEFILHDGSDDEDGVSRSILVCSGNFVIKGAGRNVTKIVMDAPMQPKTVSVLYSSPEMIQIKHNSGLSSFSTASFPAEKAGKGTFSLEVTSTLGIAEGDWVCLYVKNSAPDFVAQEVAPYTADSSWDIVRNGVEIIDYHQIKSVSGNVITFCEPLMHEVDPQWGWELKKFPHYENVGIEDLTFKGNAVADFEHHKDWNHDGGYKPVSLNRLVNSWIRRVGFESTSEACTILNSSNVSAYDITMTGNRGHAAVRSQASSRVLIAATADNTSDGAGNFHGVGVSRHSIGTVLWRNTWGNDSCFESHAMQPRATLIDCCSGGWFKSHQGGDSNQAPHHLADLTIWNFKATEAESDGAFQWWLHTEKWWKFLPPVIVGFRSGGKITFDLDQVALEEFHESVPDPESLYEAQLKNRLGYVPAWIEDLKQQMIIQN